MAGSKLIANARCYKVVMGNWPDGEPGGPIHFVGWEFASRHTFRGENKNALRRDQYRVLSTCALMKYLGLASVRDCFQGLTGAPGHELVQMWYWCQFFPSKRHKTTNRQVMGTRYRRPACEAIAKLGLQRQSASCDSNGINVTRVIGSPGTQVLSRAAATRITHGSMP